jgi:thiamine monophosphate kinase
VQVALDLAAVPSVPGVSPQAAAASGEEYELLLAFPGDAPPDRDEFRQRFGLPLTAIGRVKEGGGVRLSGLGSRVDLPRGHDHLS